jgi:hypothetical protein
MAGKVFPSTRDESSETRRKRNVKNFRVDSDFIWKEWGYPWNESLRWKFEGEVFQLLKLKDLKFMNLSFSVGSSTLLWKLSRCFWKLVFASSTNLTFQASKTQLISSSPILILSVFRFKLLPSIFFEEISTFFTFPSSSQTQKSFQGSSKILRYNLSTNGT